LETPKQTIIGIIINVRTIIRKIKLDKFIFAEMFSDKPTFMPENRKSYDMALDLTDKKLLALLQSDSKQTTKELSLKTNLSVTAVYERIKKLERDGIITKYVALVNRNKIQKGFVVFCHIKLLQHSKDFLTRFESEVTRLDEVLECFHVSGDYDYILKVCVENMEEYREFMVTKLTTLQHIGSTHSTFMISEVKNTTAYSL
jgi:Lrp/AsnC family leucine-responsive transcriptional regulator